MDDATKDVSEINLAHQPKEVANADGVLSSDPFIEGPERFFGYLGRAMRILARTGAVRYAAYTSDVGEAFRPIVHRRVVQAGYAVSWSYVLGDIAFATYRAKRRGDEHYLRVAAETAVFQTFGSMLFPMVIIHTVVHQSEAALARAFPPISPPDVAKASGKPEASSATTSLARRIGTSKWTPTMLGLAVIPFLPMTVDKPVEMATEWLFNRYWPVDHGSSSEGHHHDADETSEVKQKKNKSKSE